MSHDDLSAFQGLQLMLREMSNPLDGDSRRPLALQTKGTALCRGEDVHVAPRGSGSDSEP